MVVGGGGLPSKLHKCAGWYLWVHTLGFEEEMVYPPAPALCPANNKVLKNTVRIGVFVGHAVRYLINSVPKPGT